MSTQWHTSGLRYESLALCLDLEAVPRAAWPMVVDGLQVLEAEIMRLAREKRGR
jgi:hypothetical protein